MSSVITRLNRREIGLNISKTSQLITFIDNLPIAGNHIYRSKISRARTILCKLIRSNHSFCVTIQTITACCLQKQDLTIKEDVLVDTLFEILTNMESHLTQFHAKEIYIPRIFFSIVDLFYSAHGFSDIGETFRRFMSEASTDTGEMSN